MPTIVLTNQLHTAIQTRLGIESTYSVLLIILFCRNCNFDFHAATLQFYFSLQIIKVSC